MPPSPSPDHSHAPRRACVVWLYGLSGAGKSTLALGLAEQLRAAGDATVILDGDRLRAGLCRDLGFGDAAREENIRRVAEVARVLVENGVFAICACITPRHALRELARGIVGADRFLDVHVAASYEACARRDPKGLYARAARGEVPQFTGRDSAFEPALAGAAVIDTEQLDTAHALQALLTLVRARQS